MALFHIYGALTYMWLVAHVHCLDPVVPVNRPVGVHERRRDVSLQLRDGQPQRRNCQDAVAVHRAVPLELGQMRQAELVGEVASLVAQLGVLGFVEAERVAAVLVLVDFVVAFHAQTEIRVAHVDRGVGQCGDVVFCFSCVKYTNRHFHELRLTLVNY